MSALPATQKPNPETLELFSPEANLTSFGGKAYSLSRAAAAGCRVPPGFVVPLGVSEAQLSEALLRLGGETFAVRSSAVSEDSASRSFAGQLETFLGVARSDVAASIDRCFASANSLRAIRYAGSTGPMSVLIQRMLAPESAGVAFSADPHTGERGVVLIEAVRGLGDQLVSGAAAPESWRIAEGKCEQRHTKQTLTAEQAKEIAALAQRLEALFGAPQDIEWAIEGGVLYLLQSRPITALPAKPVPIQVIPPEGDWQRDDHHAVLSPLGWAWFQPYPKQMAILMRELGVPVKEMKLKMIGGHLYSQMVMEGGGGDKLPPRWLLWLVSRLLPSMRRANKMYEDLIDRETYEALIKEWETKIRPEMKRSIDALFVEDPSQLSDEALLTRITECLALTAKGLTYHAALGGPPMFAVGKLALFVEDELGWPMDRAFDLIASCSEKTTELQRSLEALIAANERELSGKSIPRTFASLSQEAPRLGEALQQWMRENRLRSLHYEPKNPTLGEQPELVLSIVESLIASRREPSTQAPQSNEPLLAEARARLSGARYQELERLIQKARRGHALRDENGVETVARPSGLLRWFVLELGRRIVRDIGQAEYAVFLYPEEHRAALSGALPDIGARIERRRGEESWAIHHRGPALYGKEPPAMPTDAFPSGLARGFRIFSWMVNAEAAGKEAPPGDVMVGRGIGARAVTAKARVIHHLTELSTLRYGEILICRITSPEWSVALGRVGAIVTEEGGTLSHPAIIAREYGIPAVLGAIGCTRRISTGDLVCVDPIAGTVTIKSK